MALSFERTQVGLKEFGSKVTVPNNSKAKLMYYLDCVAIVLDLRTDLPRKFLNYARGYNQLNTEESIELLALCQLLSPDVLTGKCIFENNEMSGLRNRFFELSAAESTVLATESILVAGKRVRVAKTMMYKSSWRRDYFDEPFASLTSSLRSQLTPRPRPKKDCIIL